MKLRMLKIPTGPLQRILAFAFMNIIMSKLSASSMMHFVVIMFPLASRDSVVIGYRRGGRP